MPPKHRAIRRPKRKFSGNQFTKPSKENAKRTKEAKEEAHGSNTLGQQTKKSVSSEKLLLKSDTMEPKPGKVEEPYEEDVTILRDTVTTSWSADDICLLILNISCWSDILVLYVFSSTLPVLACYRGGHINGLQVCRHGATRHGIFCHEVC